MNMRNSAIDLARLLVNREHDEQTCSACLDQLDDYVTAQLAGKDYMSLFPAVAHHMDSCVICAESYSILYIARLTEAEALAPVPSITPDLSFLPSRVRSVGDVVQDAATRLRDALAAAVSRTGSRLRVTFTEALLEALPRPQSPALALRSADDLEQATVALDLEEPEAQVNQLRLTVYPQAGSLDRCRVRVELDLAGRSWPDLDQVPVFLTVGAVRRQALTDNWGEAVFSDVPMDGLVGLQIEVDAAPPTSA